MSHRTILTTLAVGLAFAIAGGLEDNANAKLPIVLKDQGSFMVGGTVIETPGTFDPSVFPSPPDGQTFHGDHAYVQFQIPPDARDLPLVMWHGGGQSSKTWETTPDGRDGYQNIFVRRGFATYILDQPRRGRAGNSTERTTLTPTTQDQFLFNVFRLGIWPNFFPGVQFPQDEESLNQFFRQTTPDTGPVDIQLDSMVVAKLFNKIGEAVLITHSDSGSRGWFTRIKNQNVKGIVSYEPVQFVFPEGKDLPPPILGSVPQFEVPLVDFEKLTQIPIQLVYGDNIPDEPTGTNIALDVWVDALDAARLFVDTVNAHGGNAELLVLPYVGVFGNTHFPFSDLNNQQIADLLSAYLKEKGLDKRRHKQNEKHAMH
jgi:hypothetical protein